jgi:hypothetical protein
MMWLQMANSSPDNKTEANSSLLKKWVILRNIHPWINVNLHSIEFSTGCSQGWLHSIRCSMFFDHPYSKLLNFQFHVCLGKQVVSEDIFTWQQIREGHYKPEGDPEAS